MAEANPEPPSSRGPAADFKGPPTCGSKCQENHVCSSVVAKNDISKVTGKVLHPENRMPNGCVKHGLDDNGLLKFMKESEKACKEGRLSELSHSHDCCGSAATLTNDSSKDCAALVPNSCHSPNDPIISTLSSPNATAECDVRDSFSKISISDTEGKSGTSAPHSDSDVEASKSDISKPTKRDIRGGIEYVVYESELQMPDIMRLITKDLSEPYSIYTYRYFIHNWPKLCFLAMDGSQCVGSIVCKLDMHKKMVRRGYIAMLAIDQNYRRRGIGSHLVMKAIRAMVADDCDEVVLETEITNKAALRLYENLGFVRDKRLFRYYLNGVDALRLKLWLR